jgi:hypothetical protein
MKRTKTNDLWNYWISNWRDNHGRDNIQWKTTVGIGDSMYGLNIAYMRSFVNQKPTTLQVHFYHPKEYYYHFEDPESVVQRFEYIQQRYMWKNIVNVECVYDSADTSLYKAFYRGITRHRASEMYRYWSLDPTIQTTMTSNKLVVWRPTFNLRQNLNNSKHFLNDYEWQRLIDRLTDFGYNITEIDYRTPISEALYHIKTCECCLSYEGMWHYISKNLFKPHIVLSNSSITRWHTPAAVKMDYGETFLIDRDLKRFTYMVEDATERAENYKQIFFNFVNGW